MATVLDAKGWDVVTVDPDALVSSALHEMTSRGLGALVVIHPTNTVLGVISERDIAEGLVRHGCDLLSLQVGDVMSQPVPACRPNDSVSECMATMTRSRHRHVPVVVDGVQRGLVSIGDMVKHRLEELELETNVLRGHCRGLRNERRHQAMSRSGRGHARAGSARGCRASAPP